MEQFYAIHIAAYAAKIFRRNRAMSRISGAHRFIHDYGHLCCFALGYQLDVVIDDLGNAVLVFAYAVGEGSALEDSAVL